MQQFKKRTLRPWVLLAMPFLLCWYDSGYCLTPQEIFLWVSQEMNIENADSLPSIRFVDKKELCAIFEKCNRNAYLRWESQYGELQARKIMKVYLKGVVGMFMPQTETVYVGSFLAPCRQEAILAHELTHYFQHLFEGPLDPDGGEADALHLIREMKAYRIEKRFTALFCDPQV